MIISFKTFDTDRKVLFQFSPFSFAQKESRHVGFLALTFMTHVTAILAEFCQYWPSLHSRIVWAENPVLVQYHYS